MRTWSKRILGAGVIAGAAYAVWRALDERARTSTLDWTPQPFPSPPFAVPHTPEPVAPAAASPGTGPGSVPNSPWVDPDGDHCPASHPVKAKLASGIFHSPGGQMYDRTVPDRCYRDAAAAEADGLRASKR
jgi:hypothetical protein